MNMMTVNPTKTIPPIKFGGNTSRALTPEEVQEFGRKIEAIRTETMAKIGKEDSDYIYKVRNFVRYTEIVSRAMLMFGGWIPPVWLIATGMLGVSKIVENMELGHNVMHGQYDWMNEPSLMGAGYDWDNVCAGNAWKHTHNYEHHTYTNIVGKDRDLGYGTLRISEKQRWYPQHRYNLLFTAALAVGFEWFVGVHDLQLDRYIIGKRKWKDLTKTLEWQEFVLKARRQVLKDYVFFPLIAGPSFIPVFLGNLAANGIRNVWTFSIIFCGHFTEDAEIFPKSVLDNESRGHWYYRQIRGSSNLTGGRLMNLLSGNLSHQIEHHLFPDIPAHRYAQLAPEVQEICQRYGIHYNTGSFPKQFGQVVWRILRHSLPSQPKQAQVVAMAN